MKYLLMLYGDEATGETPSRISEERGAEWGEFHRFVKESGKFIGRYALWATDQARTVRPGANSALVESDGPFAETKEQLGGVYILECADMDEAMRIAKKSPCAIHGSVEVRPIFGEG